MNFLKNVLGSGDNDDNEPNYGETVERLVDRVTTSTLLEDRRGACRALKALSKKYRVEVGAQGMNALIQVLETDKADYQIISIALETLCNITAPEQFEEELENPMVTVNIGEQFTEMFIKRQENVSLILDYLAEYDFRVRWNAIKLLSSLLTHKSKEIKEVVLISPMAVSKLMDLLNDTREIIRNDALLLLINLTRGNANIQKIVAFENAFDRLYDVIQEEGCSDGGIVVEDCLKLMLNLLKNNSSNQQFFKEGSYIQRLAPMFLLPTDIEEQGITQQKISNLFYMLQIVRSLVSPSNSQQVISACQKTMRTCNLLEALSNILMGSGLPSDILTETIITVAEVIRGENTNQEYFEKIEVASNPPRPVVVVLLMSMVNDKHSLMLRTAILYCFESYLYKNEKGQTAIIETLLPSNAEISTLTAGQLLCGGLFSNCSESNWLSAVALMHALIDNANLKEQLLRVLLATSPGGTPVSLLTQCTILLQQSTYKSQSKIGILMFLSMWLSHSKPAVKAFLTSDGSISYLIAQICANDHDENEYLLQGLCAFLLGICIQFNDNTESNFRKEDLCQLLIKRIGLETYVSKLGEVSKHESYSNAIKQPQLKVKSSNDLLLNYEFCRLFKSIENIITKTIHGFDSGSVSMTELTLSQEASGLVSQYKDVIREQDQKIQALQKAMNNLEQEKNEIDQKLQQTLATNARLLDQNTLLKAQLNATGNGVNPNVNEVQELKSKLEALELSKNEEIEKLKKDQEDLLELLEDQDNRLNQYQKQILLLNHKTFEEKESILK